jgi:hypothetical protein
LFTETSLLSTRALFLWGGHDVHRVYLVCDSCWVLVDAQDGLAEIRKVPVPQHRLTPLKQHWLEIYKPIVEHMKLQVRMNTKSRCVELRVRLFLSDDRLCFVSFLRKRHCAVAVLHHSL